jgi:uncharacterized repeat protein (TIGR03803 family)
MSRKKTGIALATALAAAIVFFSTQTPAFAASKERVLHHFGESGDGTLPLASLIFDSSGNLYGTTESGGALNGGAVFELVPKSGGGWTEKVLYSFSTTNGDGWGPHASVVIDGSGNLYGTTLYGGTKCEASGCGTVFELTPGSGGTWTEKILYNFCSRSRCKDGNSPYAGLTLDASGNLYGTTQHGGESNSGTVFELTPANGGWQEKVLYSFVSKGGAEPLANVIFDASGNLDGTTYAGGAGRLGTVFQLRPSANGTWTEKVLYSFASGGGDGANPWAGLVSDSSGNLYGTTTNGGCSEYGCGVVFELVAHANDKWTEKVLYALCTGTDCAGGSYPRAGLIFDSAGRLYGTTTEGGTLLYGTVFQLTPDHKGNWSETVLHNFPANAKDGISPVGGLVFDKAGNLYGTTFGNTSGQDGTVFEITP